MSTPRPIARVSTFALVVFSWLALGILLPILFTLAPGSRLVEGEVFAFPRHVLALTTPVVLSAQPPLRLERGTLSLANQSATNAGLTGVEEPVQPVIGNGSARLVLEGAYLRLDAKAPAGESDPADGVAPLLEALQGLNFDTLSVRRCTLVIVFGDGHIETLWDIAADVSHKRKQVISAKGTYTLRGQRQSFDVAVGRQADKKAPPQAPLKVNVTAPEIDFAFDGVLDSGSGLFLAGQAELSLANVRQSARWLGAPWPRGPGLAGLKAKGQLGWTGRDVVFDRASFQIDGNQATGTLALNASGARPRINGTLAFKSLDVTGYLRGSPDEELARRLSWASLTGSESPLPLAALIDADVRISAARVHAEGLALGRSAATLTLDNGKMLADIVEFQFHDGQGAGQVKLETSGPKPRLTVMARLHDVDLGRASSSVLGHGMVQGRGSIGANLQSDGATFQDLLKSLSGKATVSIAEPGRLGIDLRPMLAAGARRNAEMWRLAVRGQMPVDRLDLKLSLASGIVVIDQFQTSSADLQLGGHGWLSLTERKMNLRLDSEQVSGVPVKKQTLLFSGHFAEPSIAQDETVDGDATFPVDDAPAVRQPGKAG